MKQRFLVTVGRRCENVACEQRDRKVDRFAESCAACGLPLTSIRQIDWKVSAAAAAVAALLLTGLIYSTRFYLQRRAAEREASLMSQARARLESDFRGATAADADAIVRAVQADLQLNDRQQQLLAELARGFIAKLPRALTADVQQRLEMLVRDLYRDGRIAIDEQVTLDQFTSEHRLAPQAAQAFVAKLTGRLDDSYQNLAQGRALAGQGRYDDALLAFNGATQIDPGNATAWANLGAIHILLGQEAEARSCYDKALRLDPENWLAHYNLALLAARTGERESAFQHLEEALTALPSTASSERRGVIDGLLHEPALADLRQDPRFAGLLSGAGTAGGQP